MNLKKPKRNFYNGKVKMFVEDPGSELAEATANWQLPTGSELELVLSLN